MVDFSYWDFGTFSPFIWQITSDLARSLYGVILFVLCSIIYLAVCRSCRRLNALSDKNKEKLLGGMTFLYFIISFSTSTLLFDTTIGPQVSIPALILTLLFLQIVICVMLAGVWLGKIRYSFQSPSLKDYLITQYWMANLSYSLILIPLIVFGIIMIEPQNKTIYIGNILVTVGLTYIALKALISGSYSLLNLEIKTEDLPSTIKQKYQQATDSLTVCGNCNVKLLRKGFRNAIAVQSTNTIYFGVDLIEILEIDEIKAILLHEIGHLKDEKYVPLLRKVLLFAAVLYFVFQIFSQFDLINPFLYLFIFFLGIFTFIQVIRKIRLKSEFVADSYVKEHSAESHQHLVTALEKLQKINLIDKDFCKDRNYAHLDLDERYKMVSEGKFQTERRSGVRSTLVFIGTVLLVVFLQMGYHFLPSSTAKWRKMHDTYHDLYSDQHFTEAYEVIDKAYTYAKSNFGAIHYRTYLSTVDLAKVSLSGGNIVAAEKYGEKALQLGDKLFRENNTRQIRSIRALIAVYLKQDRIGDVVELYSKILRVQKRSKASPAEISATLFSVMRYHNQSKDSESIIASLQELLSLYEGQTKMDKEQIVLYDLFDILYEELEVVNNESILTYLFNIHEIIQAKYGEQSIHYATYLAELAYYQEYTGDYLNAKETYNLCIERFTSIDITVDDDFRNCLYNRATIAQNEQHYEDAKKLFLKSVEVGKSLYGDDTFDIKHEFIQLAEIFTLQSMTKEAIQYFKRAINLEKKDPQQDEELLLHSYKALLSLPDKVIDDSEILNFKSRIIEIEKKLSQET